MVPLKYEQMNTNETKQVGYLHFQEFLYMHIVKRNHMNAPDFQRNCRTWKLVNVTWACFILLIASRVRQF